MDSDVSDSDTEICRHDEAVDDIERFYREIDNEEQQEDAEKAEEKEVVKKASQQRAKKAEQERVEKAEQESVEKAEPSYFFKKKKRNRVVSSDGSDSDIEFCRNHDEEIYDIEDAEKAEEK